MGSVLQEKSVPRPGEGPHPHHCVPMAASPWLRPHGCAPPAPCHPSSVSCAICARGLPASPPAPPSRSCFGTGDVLAQGFSHRALQQRGAVGGCQQPRVPSAHVLRVPEPPTFSSPPGMPHAGLPPVPSRSSMLPVPPPSWPTPSACCWSTPGRPMRTNCTAAGKVRGGGGRRTPPRPPSPPPHCAVRIWGGSSPHCALGAGRGQRGRSPPRPSEAPQCVCGGGLYG